MELLRLNRTEIVAVTARLCKRSENARGRLVILGAFASPKACRDRSSILWFPDVSVREFVRPGALYRGTADNGAQDLGQVIERTVRHIANASTPVRNRRSFRETAFDRDGRAIQKPSAACA